MSAIPEAPQQAFDRQLRCYQNLLQHANGHGEMSQSLFDHAYQKLRDLAEKYEFLQSQLPKRAIAWDRCPPPKKLSQIFAERELKKKKRDPSS